jgi:Protein of unknown function (DUF2971)
MSLLYKYVPPDLVAETPRPLRILQTMQLLVANPCSFNDPFEVRPAFDQERHDHAARTSEAFHWRMLGIEHPIIQGRSMVGQATETAFGFGERLNERFRTEIGQRFRILSLSKNRKSVLMWGHYASSHRGVAVGIDSDASGFYQGHRQGGFEIHYSASRDFKLPLAWYRNPRVEVFDSHGNILNSPDEPVESAGGLVVSFREYRRQVDEASITALTTKAQDWHYEQEVRFIYDLSRDSEQLVSANNFHFVVVPVQALREIIVGFHADVELVRAIVSLYREGRIGKPRLFISGCHPYLYEVQAHETDDQYLLDYFVSGMAT